MTVPRKRQREKGHIKDLWCPVCQKIVKMEENRLITLEEKEKWEEKKDKKKRND